jgi:hypothetical protein
VKPEAALDAIRQRLLAEAEKDLAAADRYRLSKQQGERSSAPIIARRGLAAVQAVELLDVYAAVGSYVGDGYAVSQAVIP